MLSLLCTPKSNEFNYFDAFNLYLELQEAFNLYDR